MRRLAWLSPLFAVWLGACVTAPEVPPPAPEPPKPISSADPVVVPVASPKLAPKPVRQKTRRKTSRANEKAQADKAAEKTVETPAEKSAEPPPPAEPVVVTPAESVHPAPVAKAAPIKGPAWLARCVSKRVEGGVILCEADSLLVQPSASVKVYTREPALAGKIGNGGQIFLRASLPRRYRFFVVP